MKRITLEIVFMLLLLLYSTTNKTINNKINLDEENPICVEKIQALTQ